jgi:hypothetical protein
MDNRLKKAAYTGNTVEVKALLEAKKIRFDMADRFQRTALHHVASCEGPSAKSCAEVLLQDEKLARKLDQPDCDGDTPLLIAVYYGSPAIYPLLEAKPQSLNLFDKDGYTALHNVVMSGIIGKKAKTDLTHRLLLAGADVGVENYAHRTALHCATGMGKDFPNNAEAIILLLQAGAKIHRVDQVFACLEVGGFQDYSDRKVYDILLQLQKACQNKITLQEKAWYWAGHTEPEIAEIQKNVQAQINQRIGKLSQLYNYLSKKEQDFLSVLEVAAGMPTEMAKIIHGYTRAAKFFKPFRLSSLDEVIRQPENFKHPATP